MKDEGLAFIPHLSSFFAHLLDPPRAIVNNHRISAIPWSVKMRRRYLYLAAAAGVAVGAALGCSGNSGNSGMSNPKTTNAGNPGNANSKSALPPENNPQNNALQMATFGGGCFWCTEAVFQQLKGVQSVMPGYSGGQTKNPQYEEVCAGTTGHAEVIQITFDPKVVSYVDLLEVFWKTHDPTTLNQQGNDHGTQYRSVIFHHDDQQRDTARQYKE